MDKTVNQPYQRHVVRGQARAAVLEAAARLLAKDGYHRTSISDIAEAARVARPTVFTAVGSKPAVLRAVMEATLGGLEPSTSALHQPWFARVLAEPDPRRMLELHSRNIRQVGERISDLYYATEMAANSDPDVAVLWAELEEGRLEAAQVTAAELVTRPGLRPGRDAKIVADILFGVISPNVYRSLVTRSGWTPDEFEAWATDTLVRTLLEP